MGSDLNMAEREHDHEAYRVLRNVVRAVLDEDNHAMHPGLGERLPEWARDMLKDGLKLTEFRP